MKKLILTCFLASLCLYGSTLLAQVAVSPGADFLHRSVPHVSYGLGDTHRGGETRSDTLPDLRDSKDSDRNEVGAVQAGALIYGQVRDHAQVESVKLVFWDNYLEEAIKDPAPYEWIQKPEYGEFFSGAPREQVFNFEIPEFSRPGYISLYVKDRPILDKYLLMPGDSVKIRIDLMHGQTVFAGPAAPQFQCRYLIDSRRMAEEFGNPMQLTVDNAEKELSKGENRKQYEKTNSSFARGFQLIERGEQELDILRARSEVSWEESDAFQILSRFKSKIPEAAYEVLRADFIGAHYSAYLMPFYKYVHSFGMAMDSYSFD